MTWHDIITGTGRNGERLWFRRFGPPLQDRQSHVM